MVDSGLTLRKMFPLIIPSAEEPMEYTVIMTAWDEATGQFDNYLPHGFVFKTTELQEANRFCQGFHKAKSYLEITGL